MIAGKLNGQCQRVLKDIRPTSKILGGVPLSSASIDMLQELNTSL
jgi:hypothetical protein